MSEMSAIEKLEMVGTSKPYFGFTKLALGYHEILRFKIVKNKFAKKIILVELKDEIVFLPQYYMDVLSEQDVNELNSTDEKQFLFFGGRSEESK